MRGLAAITAEIRAKTAELLVLFAELKGAEGHIYIECVRCGGVIGAG
jgi:hypothetical protein